MPSTMRDTGSAFSFSTTKGHTTHISILWVFVLFCFLTVSIVLLAGYQSDLMKRELPETKIFGDLEVTGDSTVSGDNTFSGDLAVTGNETVTGNTTVGGTLGVTGVTTLGAAIVGGALTASQLGVTNNANIGSTLDVTDATTLSSTLAVTGATTLSSTVNSRGLAIGVGNLPAQTVIAADATTGTLIVNADNGSVWVTDSCVLTLPIATAGRVLRFTQLAVVSGSGPETLSFQCDATAPDAYRTGQIIYSTITGTTETSGVGETILRYTSVNATTNLMGIGTTIDFVCYTDGLWDVLITPRVEGDGSGGAFTFEA